MSPAVDEVLEALAARGFPSVEVYAKRGRSRVVEATPTGAVVSYHREEGWAARAGDDRRSLFAAGTGPPDAAGPGGGWPEPDGAALELPESPRGAAQEPSWREPGDLDAPLVGEREAMGLLATLREALAAELRTARCVRIRLADGASEWDVASRVPGADGVAGSARGRVALLRVEAVLAGERTVAAEVEVAAREARSFDSRAIARRLADRLSVAAAGISPERDRAVLLLAPPVGSRLLAALLPLLVGPRGTELASRLADRNGRLGSPQLHVVDDGRLPGGVLAARWDGEGVATAPVRLVEGGVFRQPLLSWRDGRRAAAHGARSVASQGSRLLTGCMRRSGWRDLPRPGPSHLFVAADPEVGVGRLLAEVPRGYYLIDVDGPPVVDWDEGRLSVPVVGFAVERGRRASPLAGATVEGSVGGLLRGVDAAARDLAFLPLAGGMVGAPTLLVSGLEIHSARPR